MVLVPLVLAILVVALVNRFKPESTPPESEAYGTYLALSREAGLSEAFAREQFDQEWIDRWGLNPQCGLRTDDDLVYLAEGRGRAWSPDDVNSVIAALVPYATFCDVSRDLEFVASYRTDNGSTFGRDFVSRVCQQPTWRQHCSEELAGR